MKKYRPSNGSEGLGFYQNFCDKCVHDRQFSEATPELGCQILAATFRYQVTDPEYPEEWQKDEKGNGYCTKFEVTAFPATDPKSKLGRAG